MTRHDVRAGNGRYTAERTTTTTVTTEEVTERVIVEPPAPVPVLAGDPAPVFGHLIRHPPAQRWAHPDFIADMAARAAAQAQAGFTVPFDETAPVPVIRVPVPVAREYPELWPDVLDSQFTGRDRERLLALDHDGSL